MASLTQWAWVWVNSRSWWWTGRPGVLQSIGSQTVRHDWETELNWTDAEAKAAKLCWPDAKSQIIGKDPDAGKDWGQEKKGVTEDEMVGWHHWLNECDFEQTPGDSEGQGGLVCSSVSCSHKSRAWVIDWTITRLFKGLLWPDGLEGNFGGAAGETQEEKYRTASAQATVLSQCWGERPSVGILLIVLVGKGLRLLVFPSVEWIWHMQRVTPVAPHFTLKAMMQNPR